MNKLSRILATAPHHLWTLLDNYRHARKRAKNARAEHARIAAEGRYHLDGVTPHCVREDRSFHEEKHAALALADFLARHAEHYEISTRSSRSSVSAEARPSEC
jgi:hypothetical protein